MRLVHGLAAIALAAGAVHAGAVPLDFKGLVLGAAVTSQEVEERLGAVRCGEGAEGVMVCNGRTTVAGVAANVNVVISAAGLLQRVLLDLSPDHFDAVAEELQKKFGKPQGRNGGTVQNAYGARFSQTDLTWSDGRGGLVNFRRYAGSIDVSNLYFSTPEERRIWSAPSKTGDL